MAIFSRCDVESFLPIGKGFLFVTEVEDISTECRTIKAKLKVDPDAPYIKDHFGLLPGVLNAESCHQAGAILAKCLLEKHYDSLRLAKSHFSLYREVKPGEELCTCVKLRTVEYLELAVRCEFTMNAFVNGCIVMRGSFMGVGFNGSECKTDPFSCNFEV